MSLSDSCLPWSQVRDGVDVSRNTLLQSIVEVARGVFAAAAASVFLVDQSTGELVFAAVAGEGEDHLVGTRFPSGTGIAGWVAACGQPLLVDDVSASAEFARDAAASTGYVPRSIMAAPLIQDGECLGVLEVLDRNSRPRDELGDVGLLDLLATEVATGLELLVHLGWARRRPQPGPAPAAPDPGMLWRMAERLPAASGPVSATVARLLGMADELLSADRPATGQGHA